MASCKQKSTLEEKEVEILRDAIDIAKKISLYEEMNSQVRGHRSTKHVKTIAELRGMQSNHEYAEAFEILRWIE